MVSISGPALDSYIFYSAILAIKMLMTAFLTVRQRFAKKVFANDEDAKANKGKVKLDDPDVERARRAHLNDLENITPFWVLGALYVTTGPSVFLATWLFRIFTVGRILHTIVYAVMPLPQPARAIAFFVPYLVTFYMGAQVILYYLAAM